MAHQKFLFLFFVFSIILGDSSLTEAKELDNDETCGSATYLSDWTETEKAIWDRVHCNETADLDQILEISSDDHSKPMGWNPERKLRAKFLEDIVFHPKRYENGAPYRIHIVGAWFDEPIELEYASLPLLWLNDSRFDKRVSFAFSSFPATLSFEGSWFLEELSLRSVEIGGGLNLAHVTAESRVLANSADIRGTAVLRGAMIRTDLKLNQAFISEHLRLIGTQIGGDLDLIAAKIGGDLTIREDDDARSSARNRRAEKRSPKGSAIDRLIADSAKIGLDVRIRKTSKICAIMMNLADIGRDFVIEANTLTRLSSLRHHRLHGEGEVSAPPDPTLRRECSYQSPGIRLSGVKVVNDLVLQFDVAEAVDLREAIIGRLILDPCRRVQTCDDELESRLPSGVLNLRDLEAGILDLPAVVPWKSVDLIGAKFDQIEGRLEPPAGQLKSANDVSSLSFNHVISWLKSSDPFSFGTYQTMASTLEVIGEETLANDVRYEGRKRARQIHWKNGQPLAAAEQSILGAIIAISYGTAIVVFALLIVTFVLIGAFVASRSTPLKANSEHSSNSKQPLSGVSMLRHLILRACRELWFSLDLLLPIFELDQAHYKRRFTWPGHYYFYFHRIAGLVIASVLIAGLTRLAG